MADLGKLLVDLAAEGDDLDGLVADLALSSWATPTPAEGWTIAHQVAHLTWTDEVSVLAATDAPAFAAEVEAALENVEGFVDRAAEGLVALPPGELLERWRAGRRDLVDALSVVPVGERLPWFGPSMSAASMATARLMETFAHGQDIADALGVTRLPTARLRHVAHIGVRTRNFAYASNLLSPPADEFRIELTAPGGETWTWGPEDASQRVTGPALHFCLLVTQRRHLDDLSLVAEGSDAEHWLTIAQAFAGPSGGGRDPLGESGPESG